MQFPGLELNERFRNNSMGRLDLSKAHSIDLASTTRHLSLKISLDGTERYHTLGQSYAITSGHLLVLPPNEPFAASSSASNNYGMCVDIAAPFWQQALQREQGCSAIAEPSNLYGLVLHRHSTPQAGQLFQLLGYMHAHIADASQYEAWFVQIAGLLNSINKEVGQQTQRLPAQKRSTQLEILHRITKLEGALRDHLRTPLCLAEMARLCGMSKYHMLRNFRAVYGCTPNKYLERLRMQKARELLAAGNLPVFEVAQQCGFDDQRYFARRFRKHFGRPPSQL